MNANGYLWKSDEDTALEAALAEFERSVQGSVNKTNAPLCRLEEFAVRETITLRTVEGQFGTEYMLEAFLIHNGYNMAEWVRYTYREYPAGPMYTTDPIFDRPSPLE